MKKYTMYYFVSLLISMTSCKKSVDDSSGSGTTTVPAAYSQLYGATNVYVEGDYVVVKSTGVPDHKSPYFATTSSMYINDTRVGFNKAPGNTINTFSYTFKFPLNPVKATTTTALGAATIGIAINGVPFFNQYQMGNILITPTSGEYTSFDLYGGHPTPFNEYHYHIEPNYLTTLKGKSALMGFMLDGFPIYGPLENGVTLTSTGLDAYHGHTHATTEYPNGIYHYHITADAPYINGNGYYGIAGTWSK
jgi:YHYH protein